MTEPGSGERRPPTAEEMLQWQKADLERRQRKPKGGTLIVEHLDLEETAALDRARKRAHPTSGSTSVIPVRTGFQGQTPPRPDR